MYGYRKLESNRYDYDLEEDLSYKIVGGRPNSQGGGMAWNDIDEMNEAA